MSRAAEMSDEYKHKVEEAYKEWMSHGQEGCFLTPTLYKNRGGIAESYMTVGWAPGKSKLLLIRIVKNPGKSPQEYVTEIKGTATLTPADRVLTEIEKRTTKKLRDAWAETVGEVTGATAVSKATLKKPMLLHKWDNYKSSVQWPVVVQPKYDGIRAYYDHEENKLYSRSGKVIPMAHLEEELKLFGLDLDGELCFNDLTTPLQDVTHAVAHQDKNLCYHIFDAPVPLTTYADRFLKNLRAFVSATTERPHVFVVQTTVCNSTADVEQAYATLIAAGAEGLVVKEVNHFYTYGKRSPNVLKYKAEFQMYVETSEFEVDVHPSYPEGLVKFVCRTDKGLPYFVVPAWSHSDRNDFVRLIKDVGMTTLNLEIEYRGFTKDGKPVHAVAITPYSNVKEELTS